MSIYLGSRYETAALVRVADSVGNVTISAFRGESPISMINVPGRYLVVDGDRLDRLAEHFYGSADLWWVIADANSDVLLPDPLTPGIVLVIPSAADIR